MCCSVVVTIGKEMKILNLDNYVNKRHKLCRLKDTFSYCLIHILSWRILYGRLYVQVELLEGRSVYVIFWRDVDDFIAGVQLDRVVYFSV